jgi:Protein of unknown function (DUF3396)
MNKSDMNKLTFSASEGKDRLVYVRPGIVATFYVGPPAHKAAHYIADGIVRYLDFVGMDSIASFLSQNGTFKEFSSKRLERDLKIMRNADPTEDGPDLEYSSDPDGGVGDYGISVTGAHNDDKLFPRSASLARFDFPADAVDRHGLDDLLEFAQSQATVLKAQSGNVGFAFKRSPAFESEATKAINPLLLRYTGFDPAYDGFSMYMRDRTPSAHWVNVLDKKLFAKCGGAKRLKELAADTELTERGGIAVMRGAKLPPVGDRNKKAKDLGSLPGVARFLKPLRVDIAGLGDNKLRASDWLARFDEMPAQDWDNG